MRQAHKSLRFRTAGRGLLDITSEVREWLRDCGVRSGLLTVFVRHTSASLLIQENADPAVRRDLDRFFARHEHRTGRHSREIVLHLIGE
jgi:secondary thiamine-phosphate synthase enzyme